MQLYIWDEEQEAAYNHTMYTLIRRPPYSHTDMVHLLADGRFLINGRPSNYEHAAIYVHAHKNPETLTDLALAKTKLCSTQTKTPAEDCK